jgi:dipeptidyl aminopeptidase/acylaminoacyl peptidase
MMRHRLLSAARFGIAGFVLSALAQGQSPPRPPVDTVLDALDGVSRFGEVTISPDGARAAWVEKLRDREGRDVLSAVWVRDASARESRRVTGGSGASLRERAPVFSPDGRTLAFLSDAGGRPGQLQIWTAPAGGGPPRRVTRLEGQLEELRFSPDGRSISFLYVEGSIQETGALVAYKPDAGVVGERPDVERIAVLELATGKFRFASPANLYVYDYDWSPDGKTFVAEAVEGSGTNDYWIAGLFLVDTASGAVRSLWKPPLQIACPRFSPDGKRVAIIHGIMSDEGSNGGDIWEVPVDGGAARNRTPDWKASARSLEFRPSGRVRATEHVDGEMGVVELDSESGRIETLWRGPETIERLASSREGDRTVVLRESFERAPEIAVGPLGAWKACTSSNAGAKRYWGKAESLHWESGGLAIQGWLLFPDGFDPARRYPLAVSVHGGPSAAATPSWPARWNALLPSQGYFVLLPNPRGSYGFGEAFTQGNVKDFGHGDLQDILAGVDAALRAAPIDPKRLGILGWSYGGYMTMWAVTQTDRFAAAVAGAGIVDWRSYYGQNRIDRWMIPFFGASVYEDPEVYAKSSPIEFIRKVKTPTLVLHGDRDSEVPTPQGYEFWHALKTLGVPTELVIFENEGHAIRKREHARDRDRRIVGWFDRYLGGAAGGASRAGSD